MKSDFVNQYDVSKKVVLYQLLYHCELMYDYLTETGKKVPEWVSLDMSEISLKTVKLKTEYEGKKISGKLPGELENEF